MKIKFLNGKDSGREFEINSQSVSIGRDPANLISFDTDGVSRCHAEMKQLPSGEWMLYDLNSTNGVKVNNKKIDSFSPVSEGDIIGIGENSFCISARVCYKNWFIAFSHFFVSTNKHTNSSAVHEC